MLPLSSPMTTRPIFSAATPHLTQLLYLSVSKGTPESASKLQKNDNELSFPTVVFRTILLRKMTDFIRKADMRGDMSPRDTPEFRRLDRLIATFRFVSLSFCLEFLVVSLIFSSASLRSSFPAELSSTICCVASGKAIDRNLVLAQSLTFS